jgi:hypothetical protein
VSAHSTKSGTRNTGLIGNILEVVIRNSDPEKGLQWMAHM